MLTVLAGSALYWFFSGGLILTYIKSGVGLGFTIGSVASLIAFLVGTFGIGPTSGQLSALGWKIIASGYSLTSSPPS